MRVEEVGVGARGYFLLEGKREGGALCVSRHSWRGLREACTHANQVGLLLARDVFCFHAVEYLDYYRRITIGCRRTVGEGGSN